MAAPKSASSSAATSIFKESCTSLANFLFNNEFLFLLKESTTSFSISSLLSKINFLKSKVSKEDFNLSYKSPPRLDKDYNAPLIDKSKDSSSFLYPKVIATPTAATAAINRNILFSFSVSILAGLDVSL